MVQKLSKIFIAACFLVFLIIFSFKSSGVLNLSFHYKTITKTEQILKNSKYKINNTYALVFYGRKAQSSILLRYLQKNLKINGGVLDKIVFAVKTDKKPDLDYLDSIIQQNKPYYEKVIFKTNKRYREIYDKMQDDDLIFKIDDDIVFIADGTFERMLEEYLTKDLLFLSGNVVNHPLLSYVHARLRIIMPFYELENNTWVKATNITELDKTNCSSGSYGAFSMWWRNGRCAAMAHESFFYHIYNDNLNIYDFNVWDFHSAGYERWSINFVLMRGKYANKMKEYLPKLDDDEVAISRELPKIFGKHCYALGSAVVSHFSYNIQIGYLRKTDILKKYDLLSKRYLGIK